MIQSLGRVHTYFNFCSFWSYRSMINRLCPTHKLVLITFLTFRVPLMSWISLISTTYTSVTSWADYVTTFPHRSCQKYLTKQTTALFNYVPWIVAFWAIAVWTIVDLIKWSPAFHLYFWQWELFQVLTRSQKSYQEIIICFTFGQVQVLQFVFW